VSQPPQSSFFNDELYFPQPPKNNAKKPKQPYDKTANIYVTD